MIEREIVLHIHSATCPQCHCLQANTRQALVKPRDASILTVLSWLDDAGIPAGNFKNDNEWIDLTITVADAEKLLKTTFHHFTKNGDKEGKKIIRTVQYSLPRNVAPLISMIQPTTRFPNLRPQKNGVFKAEYLGELSLANTAASVGTAGPSNLPTVPGLSPSAPPPVPHPPRIL